MTLLRDIKLTSTEVDDLMKNQRFSIGGESVICHSDNPRTLYKIFAVPRYNRTIIEMPENKFSKVKELYQKKLKSSVQPVSTISMDGRLIGYEMTYDPSFISLEKANLSRKETIKVLKKTRDILLYFDSQDVTYSDIKSDNILVNPKTKEVMFCDMDNTRIGQYPVDIKCFNLMRFYEIYGKIDNVVQAYMHNLLTLEQLGFKDEMMITCDQLHGGAAANYHNIVLALRRGERPTRFKQKAQETFDSMTSPTTFNGEYVIQYVKR